MRTFTHSLRRLVPIRCTGAGILLLGVIITSVPLGAAEVTASNQGTVIFVCKYGSMKSQMAAAYFNRLAKERGLHLMADRALSQVQLIRRLCEALLHSLFGDLAGNCCSG